MKWNTLDDIKRTDEFNSFMISKWIYVQDETWQIIMNPEPVMIGIDNAKFEYTLQMAIQDFKNNK